ncbi:interleukin-1 receptor-associated kinase 1-binding protein 1 homolog [Ischnura elegans]|uniref:interleukin-1 receptor-associated kinase 1-binding protein 1 homolog n=1 Tax=Ischnura elegans TaxID=197161 RepID=UPI001ED873FA|nr:interleukin-1 receptor-associated kinase 1-binding protein 1 homolog [Ischnura elegans]
MSASNVRHEGISTLDLSGKQIAKVEGYSEVLVDADIIEFEILVQMTKSSVEEVNISVSKRIDYVLYVVKSFNVKDEGTIRVRQMLCKDGSNFRLIKEVFIVCPDLKTYEEISNKLTEKLNGLVRISSARQRYSSTCLQQAREKAALLSVENAYRKASQMARVSGQEVAMALYLEEIECRQEDNLRGVNEFSGDVHRKLTCKLISRVFAIYELVNFLEQ